MSTNFIPFQYSLIQFEKCTGKIIGILYILYSKQGSSK